jgi:prepilin-type N-terminal cleavage/methylation domain-containing protein
LDFGLPRLFQSKIQNPKSAIAGFTLIEVMVALAILGMSAMVLLDAHYNALRLHADTRDQVLSQQFLEEASGQAELLVMAGTLTGTGTFGNQYPGYSYSFTAKATDPQQAFPLYEVVVSVRGLATNSDEESSGNTTMTMFVYNVGQ